MSEAPADIRLLELPIKYASIAAVVWAASSFVLGYFYEFMAFASLDLQSTRESWREVRAIAGFSFDRSIRYFIFYFLILLSLVCFDRSKIRASSWGLYVLFAAIPAVMSFMPYIFSSGLNASSYWAMLAMLVALIFVGGGPKSPSKRIRLFFYLLVLAILTTHVLSDVSAWSDELYKALIQSNTSVVVERKLWLSLLYLAPATTLSLMVNFYLIYRIPSNFFWEYREVEEFHGQP